MQKPHDETETSRDIRMPQDGQDLPPDFMLPALRNETESFPVLKAFQEYLEEERERARKRVVTISVLAISALVAVVTVFLVVGAVMFNSMSNRNNRLEEMVLQAALRDMKTPPPAPVIIKDDSEKDLKELRETLRKMQEDNAALKGQVSSLQDLPATLFAGINETISNLSAKADTEKAVERKVTPLPPASDIPFAPSAKMAQSRPKTPGKDRAPQEKITETPAPEATGTGKRAAAGSGSAGDEQAPPRVAQAETEATEPAEAKTETQAMKKALDPEKRVSLTVPPQTRGAQKIEGFAPAGVTLVTDRGIRIPWRVLIPEPQP